MNKAAKIFLDLDGVMADFERYFEDQFGFRHDSVNDQKMWEMIHMHGHFFRNLQPFEGALEFLSFLKSFGREIIVLTGCPRKNYDIAATQKREWVGEHLDGDLHVLPVIGGKNKKLFIHRPGDILIDDFEKNLVPWREVGGVGVHHSNFKDTMEQISALLK